MAITWANVDPDLCYHMASLGPNELNHFVLAKGTPYLALTGDTCGVYCEDF